jgi:hypothetical protein
MLAYLAERGLRAIKPAYASRAMTKQMRCCETFRTQTICSAMETVRSASMLV